MFATSPAALSPFIHKHFSFHIIVCSTGLAPHGNMNSDRTHLFGINVRLAVGTWETKESGLAH